MTSEAQNIAIAKALGKEFHRPTAEEIKSGSYYQYEPNYIGDLNACHEMEKVLQERCKYWPDYIDELTKLFPFSQIPGVVNGTNWSQMVHATAAQRAEAFLKTIGRWGEE